MLRPLIKQLRPLKNAPFCPISASDSDFNPRNTYRVFLWLKSSPSLTLNKIEHFSKVSQLCVHWKHIRWERYPLERFIYCSYRAQAKERRLFFKSKIRNSQSLPAIALAQARQAGKI